VCCRRRPHLLKNEWPQTDFGKRSIDRWAEILSGGPPKDGIQAVDRPTFRQAAAETCILRPEPVITIEIAGTPPRAYPVRYLM